MDVCLYHDFSRETRQCRNCGLPYRDWKGGEVRLRTSASVPAELEQPKTPQVKTQTRVWITTSFEALHYWGDAPREVEFLRHPHRHVFHVKMWWNVSHDDRQIEFILKKREVDAFIKENFANKTHTASCEHFARNLMTQFWACGVEVSEDGENGAVVEVIRGNV